MRFLLIRLFPLCLILFLSTQSAAAQLLQRDLLTNLVSAFGWDFGLPDRPGDADYLRIVNGRRQFHYEAENLILPSDIVTLKKIRNYGPFSGLHWVSGMSSTTAAHLQFLVPIGGRYQLWLNLLAPGHQISIAGQRFKADGSTKFTRVMIGELKLFPGMQELTVEIPPGGGIDYLELTAPSYPAMTPPGGWQPDQPLQWQDLAAVALQLLQQETLLPVLSRPHITEAETAKETGSATLSSAIHLGRPSAGRWLRTGPETSQVSLVVQVEESGIYMLALRGLANSPLQIVVDDHLIFHSDFGPTIALKTIGSLHLDRGPHRLRLTLPPRSGLDSIELTRLKSDPETLLKLAGFDLNREPPDGRDLDRFLNLVRPLTPPR